MSFRAVIHSQELWAGGNFLEALRVGLAACMQCADDRLLCDALLNLSMMYQGIGDTSKALECIQKIDVRRCSAKLVHKVDLNTAVLNCLQGNHKEAERILRTRLDATSQPTYRSQLMHNLDVVQKFSASRSMPQDAAKLFFFYQLDPATTEAPPQSTPKCPFPPCAKKDRHEYTSSVVTQEGEKLVVNAAHVMSPAVLSSDAFLSPHPHADGLSFDITGLSPLSAAIRHMTPCKLQSFLKELFEVIAQCNRFRLSAKRTLTLEAVFVDSTYRVKLLPLLEEGGRDMQALRGLIVGIRDRDTVWEKQLLNELCRVLERCSDVTEALTSAYFVRHFADVLQESHLVFELDAQCKLLRAYLKEARRGRAALRIGVTRGQLVEELSYLFGTLDCCDLLRPLHVTFHNETAVDAGDGGVCNDMIATFLENTRPLIIGGAAALNAAALFAVGAVMFKCLVDGRTFHFDMPAAFFSVIVEGPTAVISTSALWSAIKLLDPPFHSSMRNVVGADDVEQLSVFDDDGSLVTNASRSAFVTKKLNEKVIGSNLAQLTHMHQGFSKFAAALDDSVRQMLVRGEIVHLLVNGKGDPSGTDVVAALEFRGWDPQESTPFYLCCWLHDTTNLFRKLFLRLCTSQTTVPLGGFPKKISVFKADDVRAQTCFYQLNLPVFASLRDLVEALEAALTSLAASPEMYEPVDS